MMSMETLLPTVWTKMKYDNIIHAKAVDVSDSYGNHIFTEHDPLYVFPDIIKNSNNDFISYTYDACGRVTEEVRDKDPKRSGPVCSLHPVRRDIQGVQERNPVQVQRQGAG